MSTSHNKNSGSQQAIFKIVPVRVWVNDPSKYVKTYAFIDKGLSVNLCFKNLISKLGLKMKDVKMALVTANAVTTQTKKVENLTI